MNRTLVWFRRDLRVSDHEPLLRAAARGLVVPVFVFDRALLHHPETGSARVAFLSSAWFTHPPKIDGVLNDWPSQSRNTAGQFRLIGRSPCSASLYD